MVGQTGAIATTKAGGRRTVFGVHRFRHLTCERCGLVLPTIDDTESLLDKLTQLAQFGLTAEGRPLLESSHDD